MILKNIHTFYFSDFHLKPDFLSFFPQDDVPTARDLIIRYATNKKNTKRKKKLEKAMKVLKVRRVVSDFDSILGESFKCGNLVVATVDLATFCQIF